ncbi:hypothetical protein BESB_004100 [Besnoitia besnoiti]|uniref:Uncharacterized protein n=1 Tax=Besnoitia besnoiti TaxID=94643 RepID=A0A2A9MJH9_BESBE|nr:hypothetical protein BESB_004100 [Besnoitia besnoiti]PFH38069.1 hypothetical protein BESB_004100 [Besnoitia besnoiti]
MLSAPSQQQLLQFEWQARGLQGHEDRKGWYEQQLQPHPQFSAEPHASPEPHQNAKDEPLAVAGAASAPAAALGGGASGGAEAAISAPSPSPGLAEGRHDGVRPRPASYHLQLQHQVQPEGQQQDHRHHHVEHQAALLEQQRQELQALHFLHATGAPPSMIPPDFLMRQQIFQQQQLHHLHQLQHAQAFSHHHHVVPVPQHTHLPAHLVVSGAPGTQESQQAFLQHHGYDPFAQLPRAGSGEGTVLLRSEGGAGGAPEMNQGDHAGPPPPAYGGGGAGEEYRPGASTPHPSETEGAPRAADVRGMPPSAERGYPDANGCGMPPKELEASFAAAWGPSAVGGAGRQQQMDASSAAPPPGCHFAEHPQAHAALQATSGGSQEAVAAGGGSEGAASAQASSSAAGLAPPVSSYPSQPGAFPPSGGSAAYFPEGGEPRAGPSTLLPYPHSSSVVPADCGGAGNQFMAAGQFLVGGHPSHQAQACAGGGYSPHGFPSQFGAPHQNAHAVHLSQAPHLAPQQLPSVYAPSHAQHAAGGQMLEFSSFSSAASGSPSSSLSGGGCAGGGAAQASPSPLGFQGPLHMPPSSLSHPSASHLLMQMPGPSTPTKRPPGSTGGLVSGSASRRSSQKRQQHQGFLSAGTPSTTCTPPHFNVESLLVSASTGLPSEASSVYSGSRRSSLHALGEDRSMSRRSSAHSAVGGTARDPPAAATLAGKERVFLDEKTGAFTTTCPPSSASSASQSRRSSKSAAGGASREGIARAGGTPGGGSDMSAKSLFPSSAWPSSGGGGSRSSSLSHAGSVGDSGTALMAVGSDGAAGAAGLPGKAAAGGKPAAGGAGKETAGGSGTAGTLRGPYAVFSTQISVPPPPELEEACQRLAELKAQPLIQQWLDSRDVSWSFAFALVFNARLAAGSVNVNVRWAREPTVVGGAFLVGKGKTYSWRRAPQEASPHIILQCFEAACKERQKTFGRSQHVDDYLAVLKTDLASAWRLDVEGLQQAADSLIALHGLDLFCGLPVATKQIKDLLYFDPHANSFSLVPDTPPLPPIHFFFPAPQDASLSSDLLLGITKESVALATPDSIHSSAPPSPHPGELAGPSGYGARCTSYTFRCPAPDCLGLLFTLNRVRHFCLNAKLRSAAAAHACDVLETSTGFESSAGSISFPPSAGFAGGAGAPPSPGHTQPADFASDTSSHLYAGSSASPYPLGSYPGGLAAGGSGFEGKGGEEVSGAAFPSPFVHGMPPGPGGVAESREVDKGFHGLPAFAPPVLGTPPAYFSSGVLEGDLASERKGRSPRGADAGGAALYERLVQDGGEALSGFEGRRQTLLLEAKDGLASPSSRHARGDVVALSAAASTPLRQNEVSHAEGCGAETEDAARAGDSGKRTRPRTRSSGERDETREGVGYSPRQRRHLKSAEDDQTPRESPSGGRGKRDDAHVEVERLSELGERPVTPRHGAGALEDIADSSMQMQDEDTRRAGAVRQTHKRPAARSASKAKRRKRGAAAFSSRRKTSQAGASAASSSVAGESSHGDAPQDASVDEGEEDEKEDDAESVDRSSSSQPDAGQGTPHASSSLQSVRDLAFASPTEMGDIDVPRGGSKMLCKEAWMEEDQADRHLEAFFSACEDAGRKRGRGGDAQYEEERGDTGGFDDGEQMTMKQHLEQEGEREGPPANAGDGSMSFQNAAEDYPPPRADLGRAQELGGGESALESHYLSKIEEETEYSGEGFDSSASGNDSSSRRAPEGTEGFAPSKSEPREDPRVEGQDAFGFEPGVEKGQDEDTGLRFLDDPNTPSPSPTGEDRRDKKTEEDKGEGDEGAKPEVRKRREGRGRRSRR